MISTGDEIAPTDLDLPFGDLGGSVSRCRGAGGGVVDELTKLPKSLVC